MNCCKCFFKIQIRVCRITMLACGFAVWTTPSPRGDWNLYALHTIGSSSHMSELPPHREVIETQHRRWTPFLSAAHRVWTPPSPQGAWTEKSRYPKRYRDFFYKKLKNSAQPGIYSERWWYHEQDHKSRSSARRFSAPLVHFLVIFLWFHIKEVIFMSAGVLTAIIGAAATVATAIVNSNSDDWTPVSGRGRW